MPIQFNDEPDTVYEITTHSRSIMDDLFWEDDEIAEFRHHAFLIECGLMHDEDEDSDDVDILSLEGFELLDSKKKKQHHTLVGTAGGSATATGKADDTATGTSTGVDSIHNKLYSSLPVIEMEFDLSRKKIEKLMQKQHRKEQGREQQQKRKEQEDGSDLSLSRNKDRHVQVSPQPSPERLPTPLISYVSPSGRRKPTTRFLPITPSKETETTTTTGAPMPPTAANRKVARPRNLHSNSCPKSNDPKSPSTASCRIKSFQDLIDRRKSLKTVPSRNGRPRKQQQQEFEPPKQQRRRHRVVGGRPRARRLKTNSGIRAGASSASSPKSPIPATVPEENEKDDHSNIDDDYIKKKVMKKDGWIQEGKKKEREDGDVSARKYPPRPPLVSPPWPSTSALLDDKDDDSFLLAAVVLPDVHTKCADSDDNGGCLVSVNVVNEDDSRRAIAIQDRLKQEDLNSSRGSLVAPPIRIGDVNLYHNMDRLQPVIVWVPYSNAIVDTIATVSATTRNIAAPADAQSKGERSITTTTSWSTMASNDVVDRGTATSASKSPETHQTCSRRKFYATTGGPLIRQVTKAPASPPISHSKKRVLESMEAAISPLAKLSPHDVNAVVADAPCPSTPQSRVKAKETRRPTDSSPTLRSGIEDTSATRISPTMKTKNQLDRKSLSASCIQTTSPEAVTARLTKKKLDHVVAHLLKMTTPPTTPTTPKTKTKKKLDQKAVSARCLQTMSVLKSPSSSSSFAPLSPDPVALTPRLTQKNLDHAVAYLLLKTPSAPRSGSRDHKNNSNTTTVPVTTSTETPNLIPTKK